MQVIYYWFYGGEDNVASITGVIMVMRSSAASIQVLRWWRECGFYYGFYGGEEIALLKEKCYGGDKNPDPITGFTSWNIGCMMVSER